MTMCFNSSKIPPSPVAVWAADIISLIGIPLFCIFLRTQYIIYTTETPSTDFGSGSMFDKIAPRYDITNRFLAFNLDTSWRRQMVHEVVKDIVFVEDEEGNQNDKDAIHFLDLATGTADVALLLSDEIKKQTKSQTDALKSSSLVNVNIIGVDPSANMIDIGNQKIESRNKKEMKENIDLKLKVGDARDLTNFNDSSFDGATMAFGIRNIPEKETALCEIHRVLKKNLSSNSQHSSRLAILEFSEPDENSGILGSVARFFIRNIVPVVGATLSGAPKEYMHLQNSIQEFPAPAKFVELMENLECKYEKRLKGKFKVEALHQMNFGSVQLYIARPYFD